MKKKIYSVLLIIGILTTSLSVAVFADPSTSENNETIDDNTGVIDENHGTINNNCAGAEVTTNDENATIVNNSGTVVDNNGTVNVNNENGQINSNGTTGTVELNKGNITTNSGTVDVNMGTIQNTDTTGRVEMNLGDAEAPEASVIQQMWQMICDALQSLLFTDTTANTSTPSMYHETSDPANDSMWIWDTNGVVNISYNGTDKYLSDLSVTNGTVTSVGEHVYQLTGVTGNTTLTPVLNMTPTPTPTPTPSTTPSPGPRPRPRHDDDDDDDDEENKPQTSTTSSEGPALIEGRYLNAGQVRSTGYTFNKTDLSTEKKSLIKRAGYSPLYTFLLNDGSSSNNLYGILSLSVPQEFTNKSKKLMLVGFDESGYLHVFENFGSANYAMFNINIVGCEFTLVYLDN